MWTDLAHRIQYLRQLVISFSQARDIEKTLLVFSHDFWDPEINDLVASIDFAKTLQIFYPFSIQTHQNTFPGESKNDCPRNAKKHEWVKQSIATVLMFRTETFGIHDSCNVVISSWHSMTIYSRDLISQREVACKKNSPWNWSFSWFHKEKENQYTPSL